MKITVDPNNFRRMLENVLIHRGAASTSKHGVVIIIETGNCIKSSLPAAHIIENQEPQEVEPAAPEIVDPHEDPAEIPIPKEEAA